MSVNQQRYNFDLTVNFHHSYDRISKGESAPATAGNSEFQMRRVERLEHLTFEQCARFMMELNQLIDKFEAEVSS